MRERSSVAVAIESCPVSLPVVDADAGRISMTSTAEPRRRALPRGPATRLCDPAADAFVLVSLQFGYAIHQDERGSIDQVDGSRVADRRAYFVRFKSPIGDWMLGSLRVPSLARQH